MITYRDSSNAEDYTLLFDKASMKLGLKPIVKEVLDELGDPVLDYAGHPTYQYYKMVYNGDDGWEEVGPLVPYRDPQTGEVNSSPDIDAEGNLLITDESSDANPKPKIAIHGISSLNEYFQHISELATLAIGVYESSDEGVGEGEEGLAKEYLRHGTDPYFLRLPLDEPYFEINANTRVINVPSELRQIGVIGDKYAEIVFFKIDRYYDAVDLDTRHIYIEWEAPDGNGGVVKGVSRDFLRDTQSEPNKIIFGWLINDQLTSNVGNIRFAVRFVEWHSNADSANSGEDLFYSFSSLPAQITVVDSLHYDLFEDIHENATEVTNSDIRTMQWYLENSTPDTTDDTTPITVADPEWIRNINNFQNWETITDTTNNITYYKRDLVSDGKGGHSLPLLVEATVGSNTGSISYVYGYQEDLTKGTSVVPSSTVFEKFTLASAIGQDDKTIYYILNNETKSFDLITHDALNALITQNGQVEVYEKVAKAKAIEPGFYYAVARSAVAGKKSGRAESMKVFIPKAEPVVFNTAHAMPTDFVINQTEPRKVKNDVDQIQNPDSSNFYIENVAVDGAASTITIGIDNIGPQFVAPQEGSYKIVYEWFERGVAEAISTQTITFAENDPEPKLVIDHPGYFSVKVTNYFNNSTAVVDWTTGEDEKWLHVSAMPTLPTVNFNDWTHSIEAGDYSADITVSPVEFGTPYYEWHRVTRASNDYDEVANGFMEDPAGDIVYEGNVGHIPFKPKQAGTYYFVLGNKIFDQSGENVIASIEQNYADSSVGGVIKVTVDAPTFSATYRYDGDYPEAVMATIPADQNTLAPGAVTPEAPSAVEVVIDNTTWTFNGWNPAEGEIVDADIEFVGTWTSTTTPVEPTPEEPNDNPDGE